MSTLCSAPRYCRSVFLFIVLTLLCSRVLEVRAQAHPSLRVETQGTDDALARVFDGLDATRVPTGLLYDRVINLVDAAAFDGGPHTPPATLDSVRQLYHQLARSDMRPEGRGALARLPDLLHKAASYTAADVVPLAVTSIRYNRIRRDAPPPGTQLPEAHPRFALPPGRQPAYETHLAFAAAPFRQRSYDPTVRFVVAPELYVTNHEDRATRFEVDFGDGRGPRRLAPGEVASVHYATGGRKTIRVTAYEGKAVRHANTLFEVVGTAVPDPDRSWLGQTARWPYAGGAARFDAHVFYGAGNTALTNPIVFIEGFDAYYNDPVKRRTWQDMYLLLAEQGVADTLRAWGYDLVLLKLHNATDYVQRNAFALVHLLGLLNADLAPGRQAVVIGPSMGGLIGRFALAFMERFRIPHNVRLFATLDAPHRGANIPLGDQFFLEFFDNDSDKAREGTAALNTVAARQQLIYHYQTFPETDPLRAELVFQLALLGYPRIRTITMADGSGHGLAQLGNERVGFRRMLPGDKIVEYRHRSFFIALDGDVWAVPDTADGWTQIFEGRKDVIGPHRRTKNVYVRGTLPLDNAPGGTRDTQGEIAGGDIPYGRIYSGFPRHAWIPTVSALDLDVHPFYDLQADPGNLLATDAAGKTSTATFDALFYAYENEDHVKATLDNVGFLLAQIGPPPASSAPTDVLARAAALEEAMPPEGYQLTPAYPNPFNPRTGFTLAVSETQDVRVEVFNTLGQRVAVLCDGALEAGTAHQLVFDAAGLSSGVYLLQATGAAFAATRTMVLVK
jgi:hypothetical protein